MTTTSQSMTVYLNGELIPAEQAGVSIFDRGLLFGDGIYEGLRAFEGRVFALDHHVRRMHEGLEDAGIGYDPASLIEPTIELLARNETPDAFIYWQVTRGTPAADAPVRSRLAPEGTRPTVLAFCTPTPGLGSFTAVPEVSACTVADERWHRGLMKSTSLLGNVLAAREASRRDGSVEAILVRDGLLAEACACNVVLAVSDEQGESRLVTPSLDSVPILAGVTRRVLMERVPDIRAEPVKADLLHHASEVILLGTMAMVTSVTRLDGRPVGGGIPGPHARRLLDALRSAITNERDAAAHAPTGGQVRA